MASGTVHSNNDGAMFMILRAAELAAPKCPLSVVLEVAAGHAYQPYRVPHLLATAEMVGIITSVATCRGLDVIRLTAADVRKAIVGKTHGGGKQKMGMDLLIKHAVEANVVNWPKRSNVHMRDAAATCVAASKMFP